ncbi:Toxin [Tenacibaculum sp. 190524A02b]|uniref:Toxin ParE1/3/4 n=1 Tax=Tenacibaculum vairaonense TaxID=3137860 RepID=A0ABP1F6X4_9FLAO
MVNYKLSPKTTEDFVELYEYRIHKFGLLQAQEYANQLHEILEYLLQRPELWRKVFHIKSNLYNFRYQSHIIFFVDGNDKLYIVRILEGHRDFTRHL